MDNNILAPVIGVSGILALLGGFVTLCLWGCPHYQVYSQRMSGEAELAQAKYSQKVQVQEAEAKKEAATLLADADVERAKGVAAANKIIGESLRQNEDYLKWLYIEGLKEIKNKQIIYIPTEAGLPILEAGKR